MAQLRVLLSCLLDNVIAAVAFFPLRFLTDAELEDKLENAFCDYVCARGMECYELTAESAREAYVKLYELTWEMRRRGLKVPARVLEIVL